jgi:hypothetical protein
MENPFAESGQVEKIIIGGRSLVLLSDSAPVV